MVFAEEKLEEIGKKAKDWESTTLKKVMEKVSESKQTFTTISGIPIKGFIYQLISQKWTT